MQHNTLCHPFPFQTIARSLINFPFSLPKFKKHMRTLALKMCCGIEGDLVMVDRASWESPSYSQFTETRKGDTTESNMQAASSSGSTVLYNRNTKSGEERVEIVCNTGAISDLAAAISKDIKLLQALIVAQNDNAGAEAIAECDRVLTSNDEMVE